jgi:hypothetical protein
MWSNIQCVLLMGANKDRQDCLETPRLRLDPVRSLNFYNCKRQLRNPNLRTSGVSYERLTSLGTE